MDQYVGQNIKKYRLAYKMTLEELACRIHKSKSTMSKYEKGQISLDVATLSEIAEVFSIAPAQLLTMPAEEISRSSTRGALLARQYVYSYDGRSKRILKSVMEQYQAAESNQTAVQLFYDVPDITDVGKCKALYAGLSNTHEFIENYILQNQHNSTERVWICCINSLNRQNQKMGLLTGLSYKTMLPVAIKVMLSTKALKEDQNLINELLLTKEDIRISKKYNLFTIDRFVE